MMTYVIACSLAFDSALVSEAIALVIVVDAFAVAAEVRIALPVLVVLSAEVETIPDALGVAGGARTAAVTMWIADIDMGNLRGHTIIDRFFSPVDGQNVASGDGPAPMFGPCSNIGYRQGVGSLHLWLEISCWTFIKPF